ncbi:hypothetical protein [Escherichia coli]|uniref:hypothetical protein n=1 Tax=Escherichia coli TaxID=562 RepID=UPI0020354520|nr:hypothetical protein [Escherichia coli]
MTVVRLGRRPPDHNTRTTEPASRRFISRGASRHSSGLETATGGAGENAAPTARPDTLQQSGEDGGSVVFPPVLVQMATGWKVNPLADRVSEESRRWLASCGLTVEQMQNQMDQCFTPAQNPPVPLRPSRPAAGGNQHGRGNRMVRRIR